MIKVNNVISYLVIKNLLRIKKRCIATVIKCFIVVRKISFFNFTL